MKKKYVAAIICILTVLWSGQAQEFFSSPVNIPVFLSANFGELRPDHFHSGIDIKTQGTTGLKVFAAADGFVYQIVVSPVGFGKALYLRHHSGYSTVYAHLESFTPEIDDYVKKQQYHNKSYSVTLHPPREKFVFRQGDLIGYSGNTGSSGGPHLHFEVRKTAGEKPVNPLIFNFGVEDNLKPLIERLVVYPATKSTLINGSNRKLTIIPSGRNGNYTLPENTSITIKGTAGFGVSCRDLMNNTSNRFGINYLELVIDSIPWYVCDFREFSFSETRYINAHIDYEALVRNNIYIHRTFVLPNDKLSMYRTYMNNGLFDFSDGKVHNIKITAKDSHGNTSEINFRVKAQKKDEQEMINTEANGMETDQLPDMQERKKITMMPFGKNNTFREEGIIVSIPGDALYDTVWFTYSSARRRNGFLSPVHSVHNIYTPLHRAYRLSIKPDSVPRHGSSKLLIVSIDEKNRVTAAGGAYSNGYLSADLRRFGNFAVAIDTLPPVITPLNLSQNADMSALKEIRIKITDNLAGIKSYAGFIDGNWALFEYDPKRELIFYRFDEERITKGNRHTLRVTVTDNCDNSSVLQRDFYW